MAGPHPSVSRRQFLSTAALATGYTALSLSARGAPRAPAPGLLAVSSANGLKAVEKAIAEMKSGVPAVDAAVAGVNLVELDPEDTSVGYGGLPNEEGVVELDAAVMDGPTHNGGAVASLRNIKTPSRVALLVMRRTDHCLLVGEGALRFARAHGFQEEDLLTERSREEWLRWKENLSTEDDWFPPPAVPTPESRGGRPTGTIHLSARTASGDFGCVTTTSGLAYKIPGRVGDSPLIGAGLYLDNDVGSAGSTGRGEAVILSCGSASIVERMRSGRQPVDACLDILARIVDQSRRQGLVDATNRPNFDVKFYAISRDGTFGGAALWSGASFAVADSSGARLEPCASVFER